MLLPRLQEGGAVAIVGTRCHQDDLVGRLLEREGDKWRVLSYPSIAEEDEVHRVKAEPLSPRFSLASRLEHRDRVGEYLGRRCSSSGRWPRVQSVEAVQVALLAACWYEFASDRDAGRQRRTV